MNRTKTVETRDKNLKKFPKKTRQQFPKVVK